MSREIKFRAWDKAKKWMCFFGPDFDMDDDYNFLAFLTPKNISGPLGDHNSMERYLLMQFTGLKDKNGKEIYEGDILSFQFDNPVANYKLAVEWKTGMTECCQNSFDGYETKDLDNAEVIGNIYENPELKGDSNA